MFVFRCLMFVALPNIKHRNTNIEKQISNIETENGKTATTTTTGRKSNQRRII